MLLDKTESSFAPVLAAEKQHQLLVSGRKQALLSHLPLLSLLNAIDAQCWHPGLTLVTEPTAGRLYAYFRPLEGLDQHPLDQFWQFEPQLDLLPEAAEHLAAQVLAEIEGDSVRIAAEQYGEVPADGRPLAFPLSRQHADLTAAELSELERPVELADWPQLAPHLSSLSAELTVGLAVLAVSADGAAASLRLVNERMPERYCHVTEAAAAAEAMKEAANRLNREMLAGPLMEAAPAAGEGGGLVRRLAQRHSDLMLAGLALLRPDSWCPGLLSEMPGRSLVAVCPSLDCLAVCSPHDHAGTAQLSLEFLRAFNSETCRASRLLARPIRFDADSASWSFYSPDSGKQEFPVPTTRAQLDEYLACLAARQLELSFRTGVATVASQVRERCHACGKAAPPPPSRLMACSGCSGRRLYCDRRCQRAHWRLHKLECGK
ncbi:hypothetical protein BOX15_Mlig012058g2 [Macrostomum lignano]|uniref:MYND-type domain-containing protein n=3 Tax=Macrostomum lignano TaxID=282301 RepID=A0A267GEY5_9PLAT|nr:hypothetical protein BOX15_Mlig012058g2 [Macrostomum lignano]